MKNRICCILDTCALSFFFKEKPALDKNEIICFNSFNMIKDKIDMFVIPSIVMYELSIGISQINNDSSVSKIIFKFLKTYFTDKKYDIIDLNPDAIENYVDLFENTDILINCICNNKKDKCPRLIYKHKIDALIVSQSSLYANMYDSEYSEFWLLTEDKAMKKYKTDNLKIYSFQDAKNSLGIENTFFDEE